MRVTLPRVGASSPVRSRKSVVFPVPFRPMTPHRSPLATVNVTSLNSVVAPNSTAALPTASCVISARSRHPLLPLRLRHADRQALLEAHERHAKEERVVHQLLEPSLIGEPRVLEPRIEVGARFAVDQRVDPELLDEATQLPRRCRTLGEIDEVRPDASLGEETERLARVGALFHAEDLDFHAGKLHGAHMPVYDSPMSSDFRPAWWLPGAHLQTLWGKLARRSVPARTRTERWETDDGDFIEVHRLDADAGRPRLVLLHGLEGSPRSHYVGGLLAEARARGWGADLLVFRSCGSEPNRLLRSYHSGETGDLDFLVRRVLDEPHDGPIVLAGVSLGGNVLLKWLGERGSAIPSRVAGAAAVSVPFDLARSARHIERGFSRVYQAHFLRTLRRKANEKHRRFPHALDAGDIGRARTLWTFDDVVTAPVHGFRDAADYYARSSSIGFLARVRVPTLLLSAVDDPFLPATVLEEVRAIARDNPALVLEFPPAGGHVGFVAGAAPWRARYYAESRVASFLDERLRARTPTSTSA